MKSLFRSTLSGFLFILFSVFSLSAFSQTIQLNILYVHGVQSSASGKLNAANSLIDLEAAVNNALTPQITSYQNAHPGTTIIRKSARANLYTADPSPYHPANSTGPTSMDDWTVGAGCSTTAQGQPCTTAYEWRWRLKREIETKFGAGAKNVILVGHSTGARTAMEVAANTGPGGVGTMNWGLQGTIAGVVTVHGMLDALNPNTYNVVGATSFDTACKAGGTWIQAFTSSSAPGKGWCEYAGDVSGFPSANWVSDNKGAMMLISWASCSPSLWTGWNDGSLPAAAQGSAHGSGVNMVPAAGQTYLPAHGEYYGGFCHSDITTASHANHTAAVNAATNRIVKWIFNSAPRTVANGSLKTPVLSYNTSSSVFAMGGSCPAGRIDGGVSIAGNCTHPGFSDGDDHPVASSEITLTDSNFCNGSFKWTQKHDSSNPHAAMFWFKTYSLPASGGMIGTLIAN
jgi:hypothetical protein